MFDNLPIQPQARAKQPTRSGWGEDLRGVGGLLVLLLLAVFLSEAKLTLAGALAWLAFGGAAALFLRRRMRFGAAAPPGTGDKDQAAITLLFDQAERPLALCTPSGVIERTSNSFSAEVGDQAENITDLMSHLDARKFRSSAARLGRGERKALKIRASLPEQTDFGDGAETASGEVDLVLSRVGKVVLVEWFPAWSRSVDDLMPPLLERAIDWLKLPALMVARDGSILWVSEDMRQIVPTAEEMETLSGTMPRTVRSPQPVQITLQGNKRVQAVDLPVGEEGAGKKNKGPEAVLRVFRPAIVGTGQGDLSNVRLIGPVFDAAPIAVAIVDKTGRILDRNFPFRALAKMAGAAFDGSISGLVQEDDRRELQRRLRAALDGKALSRPMDLVFTGREKRVGRVYFSSLATDEGTLGVTYFIDTSAQHTLQQQVSQAQKMQAVGQLAGGIAHDFNNLLTAILGFCDLLLQRHDPSDRNFADLMQIRQNSNRAANLVRQLLAFSRQQTLRPKILQVHDLLAEVSNLIRRLIGERIDFDLIHGHGLAPIKVDQGQFEQVIVNLAVNARDAMPKGGRLTLKTRAVGEDDALISRYKPISPGNYVLIEVTDTGIGIDEDNLEKIFDPFFTTKAVGQGTGLGLATVYGIIKQTGGYIFAESTAGKGTTMRVFLPASEDAQEDSSQAAQPKKNQDLTGRGRILLVEDETAVRMFAARALTNKGYTVIEAGSGEEALAELAAQDEPINLLISDVVMPQMDGPALVKRIRADLPDLPAILISGYAADDLRRSIEGDNIQFVPKPFSLTQLAEKVKEALA